MAPKASSKIAHMSYAFRFPDCCRARYGLMAAILGLLAACSSPPLREAGAPGGAVGTGLQVPMVSPTIVRVRSQWVPVDWAELPAWRADRVSDWWPVLLRGCARPAPGWVALCAQARAAATPAFSDDAARAWLQQRLQPYRVESMSGEADGLMTGYFEPLVEARRTPHGRFRIPLYAPPADLATRKPYWTRRQIDTLAAARVHLRGRALAYVADPLDALILQIQGSGRLDLTEPDGRRKLVRVAFAGNNDQPYKSVGRWLVEQGQLPAAQVSWAAIKNWARLNPKRVNEMLWSNPRVVFFREEPLPDPQVGPTGAQGRGADAGPLDRGRCAEHPVRHPRVARQHRAAVEHAAAPPGDGAGHRQRDHRRGARRLLLGLGRAGRSPGRAHEAAAAAVGAVAQALMHAGARRRPAPVAATEPEPPWPVQ